MYEIFERLCRERGVKPADVARATGIAQQTFSAWKRQGYTPKAPKLSLIAEYFGVPTEYLATGEMKNSFYVDGETGRLAQEVFEDPDLRILLDASRKLTPENMTTLIKIAEALKNGQDIDKTD